MSEPKSISGKADGVSNDDECGVPAFVAADEGGEGMSLVEANMEFCEEGKDVMSPFRGTVKVNEVFLRETFSS